MRTTGNAERTVQEALTDLEEVDRLISTDDRRGGRPGGGAGKATTYRPHFGL